MGNLTFNSIKRWSPLLMFFLVSVFWANSNTQEVWKKDQTLTTLPDTIRLSLPQPGRILMPADIVSPLSKDSQKGNDRKEKSSNFSIDSLQSWRTIFSEGFEDAFPTGNNWNIRYDVNAPYFWDDVPTQAHTGTRSGWCAGGTVSPNPLLNPTIDNYVNNMNSWMIYGPFDLTGAIDAKLDFWYSLDSELNSDFLWWAVSTTPNGNYYGFRMSGNSNGYQFQSFDLKSVPTLGNLIGQPQIYVAFLFQSNFSVTSRGAFLDDITLQKLIPDSVKITLEIPGVPSGNQSFVSFVVDGVPYSTTPLVLDWAIGSTHSVKAGSESYRNTICNTRTIFVGWEDGVSDIERVIIATSLDATYRSLYDLFVWFELFPNDSNGTATQSHSDGYYPKGTRIICHAYPNPGFTFKHWEREARGSTSFFSANNPLEVEIGNCYITIRPVFELAPNSVISDEKMLVPTELQLYQNYPNPFNPETVIEFALPKPDQVKIQIHNLYGQVVRTLIDEQKSPGYYKVVWDGRNESGAKVSSGVYFYTMTARNTKISRKIVNF